MASSILLPLLLFGPLAAALLIFAVPVTARTVWRVELLHIISILYVLVIGLAAIAHMLTAGTLAAFGDWLMIDPLAAVFVGVIGVVGCLTGFYSIGYIRHDLAHDELSPAKVKIYYGFFNLFLFTMLLVVTSNNIVMMWVGIEATTLGSAFLVGIYGKSTSLEAAWKYLIICSVGVAFGLYGTVLTFANAAAGAMDPHQAVLWTSVVAHASALDPTLVRIAFVFALIGFGTKAGIFPMHAWLPDAHSEAPSPVSALLSGVLLKCGLFVIIRYYMITAAAVGVAFPQMLFLLLGILSVGVAAFLFFMQKDLKRKLAYSSVENVGLILLGLGFGGPLGIGAALLHTINHSLAKALMFCGSGNVLMKYGTRDLNGIKGLLGAAPLTGVMILVGALAMAGFPPFNVFVSEFMTVNAGLGSGHYWIVAACGLLLTVVAAGFVQIVAGSVLGKKPEALATGDVGWRALLPMVALVVLIMIMGISVPRPIGDLLTSATKMVDQAGVATAQVGRPTISVATQK
ncbi:MULTISPECIES: hydrogenase 4 subunit F [Rhodopseudomonas]|uniref:hydrogenase 4 subunit F n=1 Tax=Rhodopseudomonas TaxID=1073 RepID=UPI0005C7EB8D|nr:MULTISPECIES: hydrogenase 4 subunit F [Rhodopseudomonas]MDF3811863.1 hydrogenase 4 subunit F [Rhodopseudomonas sp. BAL398]WOK19739.1 hydrogenase 4 subunit F [Rhodopseudomonas sp. BAL398]